jgi:uncharacterized iron-regulated protein
MKGTLAGLLLGAGLLQSACTLPPAGPPRDGAAPAQRVMQSRAGYALNRPLLDFDDSAFVWTDAGRSAPRAIGLAALAAALLGYDVVVYGEIHGHPGVHLQQLRLLRALYERDPRWVLSFEQFERDVQDVVDDYLAGRIGETTLIGRGRAWENYPTSYRPLLAFAGRHRLPVVAAEAPGWAIGCIGRFGPGILDRFTPEERAWVARDLHLGPGPYRDEFMRFVGGSATHQGDAERSFAAQAARDDTMAESIVLARRRYPGRKVLHLTGSFHADRFLGTVERLRWLDPTLKIAVIAPVEVEDPAAPAVAADRLADGTVLQLVYPTPPSFVEGEDSSAWVARMVGKRRSDECRYQPPDAPHQDAVPNSSLRAAGSGSRLAAASE